MEIILSPRQYPELRGEINRNIADLTAEKQMDPGEVLANGLDVAYVRSHLEALNRILGMETVDQILAAGGTVHVRVDDWTRKDRGPTH